jgi:hypothetical protein
MSINSAKSLPDFNRNINKFYDLYFSVPSPDYLKDTDEPLSRGNIVNKVQGKHLKQAGHPCRTEKK